MATVTPLPFVVALLVALAAFAVWMWFLVEESRRPYHWPEPRRGRRAAARTAAPARRPRDRGAGTDPQGRQHPARGRWSRRSRCGHSGRPAAPTGSTRITDARRAYDATRSSCACTMVGDHQLVDAGALHQRSSSLRTVSGSPTTCDEVQSLHLLALERREPVLGRLLRRRVDVGPARAQAEERERTGRGQPAGVLVGLAAHDRHPEHHVRRLELGRRPERARGTSASASSSIAGAKWYANEYGMPSTAAAVRAVGARPQHPDRRAGSRAPAPR